MDPAILAAIEHRFIATTTKKTKNADTWVWGNVRGDQKPETFLGQTNDEDPYRY